jgi:hypothetical protein
MCVKLIGTVLNWDYTCSIKLLIAEFFSVIVVELALNFEFIVSSIEVVVK